MLSFVVGMALCANAESVQIDGLYYELNTSARTATVTYESTTTSNYSSLPVNVVIPQTVTYNNVSFTVTAVSDQAFANCKALESISVPGSVTQVGTTMESQDGDYLPFYNCTALKSVRFEDGASTLYLGASYYTSSSYSKGLFYFCPLEEVYLGRNIAYNNYTSRYPFSSDPNYYGYSAFYNQPKLAKVTIGENVTKIPIHAFRHCTALSTVSFGNSLTSIPKYAFYNCEISSIDLPSSVTEIGEYAFYQNTALTSANLGTSVTTIGEYAFYNASNLKNLEMGNVIESIGEYCFYGSGLESISLPNSVTSIGQYALAYSSTLKSVTLSNSVNSIGDYALANNTGLTSVTFGNGCKTLPTAILSG